MSGMRLHASGRFEMPLGSIHDQLVARTWSGLSVASFQVAITVQEVQPQGLAAIGPCAVELATAEGLDAHRRAVTLRMEAAA